jgi:hypothetical protein
MTKIFLTVFLMLQGHQEPMADRREMHNIFECYDQLAKWLSQDPLQMNMKEGKVIELGGGCSKVVDGTPA